jgi:nucleoside-diphosphate-sugar epimerase|tara:strand:+ start:54 stop:989 length:936 start_codon:yes stop_codon:yes gene_type:complete
MKILVTGGYGFIGSRIVEKLSAMGHSISVLDNSEDYGVISKEELKKLYTWRQRNWPHVHQVHGDVTDKLNVLTAFKSTPDVVIHLASYPRAKIVNNDPVFGTNNIIGGTVNLLWHCQHMSVKKFVFVSSSMIYGHFSDGTREDADTKPNNIYGEAKLSAERMVKHYHSQYGINYAIVRPSGVYGPGDMEDRVLSKFFRRAMNNETIEVHDGDNRVDFTYVEDTADGIIKAALSDVSNKSFNITAGNATSLRTAAEKIIALTGSKSNIVDTGANKLYPKRGTLDITRAKDLLGYQPKTLFDEGLKKYYEWLR